MNRHDFSIYLARTTTELSTDEPADARGCVVPTLIQGVLLGAGTVAIALLIADQMLRAAF